MFFHRPRRGIAPTSQAINIRDFILDHDKPMWASLAYWVDTPALLAGTFSMNVSYVDPIGVTRVISGNGAVNLTLGGALGGGYFTLPPQLIVLGSDTSAISLNLVLTGAAFASLIGYDLIMSDFSPANLSVWND